MKEVTHFGDQYETACSGTAPVDWSTMDTDSVTCPDCKAMIWNAPGPNHAANKAKLRGFERRRRDRLPVWIES
jgi:hypothetical protein